MTALSKIYDAFFSKITDDMYMELSQEETYNMTYELFEAALPSFEFPRFDVYSYSIELGEYPIDLAVEEINIIAIYMVVEWINRQLASIELTRMKYSGTDFKFTSQANHMQKLNALKKEYQKDGFHLQRLYKRRKADKNGIMRSTFGSIMESSFKGGR